MQSGFVVISKKKGKYLVARLQEDEDRPEATYILLFKEDYDALSYLNTHGQNLRDRLMVESASANQLKGLLQRWGYQGIALVEDPLIPTIQFMRSED
ncbi:hypothetical protein Sta7437_1503 [Stanieria cyanosphaera PCC 7437]|uniref:Uncharacterized protein n=1 Tax=Stanieria cyanosphaera (strain ATCC 29371 / PCC 7437) TaxID=111780 RepID=K9XR41_STAC7|nr:hypothetical protein [Stanieria cyanosphaera]AFZ35070.1 hypothetical protein Sta7437_1503 [Stanieria cyanosphaera PCC 7437]